MAHSLHSNLSMDTENQDLDFALESLENEAAVFGRRLINDSLVRERYRKLVAATMSKAARMANHFRNSTMNSMRDWSSDIGRALASEIKPKGHSLEVMLDAASKKLFQKPFSQVSGVAPQRQIFLQVIESSGRVSTNASLWAGRLGILGRGLAVATAGIAIYEVANAKDPFKEAAKQGTSLGLGYGLSVAGGWVGAFCGPGAIVCVPLGVFVGGALGAGAAELIY